MAKMDGYRACLRAWRFGRAMKVCERGGRRYKRAAKFTPTTQAERSAYENGRAGKLAFAGGGHG